MTNNKRIDTYKTVYEVYLVVAGKDVTLEELKELYTYSDGVELDDGITQGYASTSRCKEKKTGRYVVLVKLNNISTIKGIDKKIWLINTAAHEAVHTAMDMCAFVAQRVEPNDDNEHLAYLIGWSTECIYKTWTDK
jgi:hypothetical protein